MEEEKVNPMDLNGDGKVTFGEKVQYYAGKAGEKDQGQGSGAKQTAKPKDAKAQAAKTAKGAAKAASKQLGKTRGMFAAFKKEFDDASK